MIRYLDSASSGERFVVGDQKVCSIILLNFKIKLCKLFGTPTTAVKKSKSYHGELGEKTYEEIIKKSKDKNDPQQQAAKQMKKLIEQSKRYLEKEKQKGRQ
jgi:hypothetical protein